MQSGLPPAASLDFQKCSAAAYITATKVSTCEELWISLWSGQFASEPEVYIHHQRPGQIPEKPQATMEVKGNKLTVTR